MDKIEVFMLFVGIPIVWYIMRKTLNPKGPRSQEKNVQVGRFKGLNVSRKGIYYFYVAIFVLVIIRIVFDWLQSL